MKRFNVSFSPKKKKKSVTSYKQYFNFSPVSLVLKNRLSSFGSDY